MIELYESYGDGTLGPSEAAGQGSSLSVLRTFRLLRILKLVRFLPQLRGQLFVMLRTMDNVAIFFSLLILFIFIFRWAYMILWKASWNEGLPNLFVTTDKHSKKDYHIRLQFSLQYQCNENNDQTSHSIVDCYISNKI